MTMPSGLQTDMPDTEPAAIAAPPTAETNGETPADQARAVLERQQRLSESLLWRLQREFYDQRGPEAWRQGTVPSLITSNPSIADAYAQVVIAFVRDCLADSAADGQQPINIVEIGSGSGRFAYLFLKRLRALKAALRMDDVRLRLIMTDFTPSNIQAWRAQPLFKPLIESGELDLALFDAERDTELRLEQSGETLSPEAPSAPLIAVANYAFDSLTQDIVRTANGQLTMGHVTLTSSQAEEPDLRDPDLLSRLETRFDYLPVTADLYDDEELNRLLAVYQARLNSANTIIPIGALQCMRHLLGLAAGPFLLLAADKGYTHEDELIHANGQHTAVHGSVSMMVNFHALGLFFQNQGGAVLHAARRGAGLKTVAFLKGEPTAAFAQTRYAFHTAVEQFSPDDVFQLVRNVSTAVETPAWELILGLIKLSRWDPEVIERLSKPILDQVPEMTDIHQAQLRAALERAWGNYFPASVDAPFEFARMYYAMRRPQEALRYYQHSLDYFGDHYITYYNMGLCHNMAERPAAALECFERSLEIQPDYEPARAWRILVQRDMEDQAV